jgi:hypothetical protein
MTDYQVEIRFAGYAKEHIRRLIYAATRRFNIKGIDKDYIPSIILYGPSKSDKEADIIGNVVDVASKYGLVSFRIKGFTHFEVGKTWFFNDLRGICLEVEPSESLRKLRAELANRLNSICEPMDLTDPPKYQATVDLGELDDRFETVLAYFKANEEREISQRLLRLTIVRDGQTLCEYDLIRKQTTMRGVQRKPRTLGMAMGRIRRSSEEAIQPIWDRAQLLAGKSQTGRQLTLVDDNPSIRIPKAFLIGLKGTLRQKRGRNTRQLTLLEDNPSLRIPRVFTIGFEKATKTRRNNKNIQLKIFDDGIKKENGIFKPLTNLPKRLKRLRMV